MRWVWTWLSTASPPRVERAEIVPPSHDELALLFAEARRTSLVLYLFLLLAATTAPWGAVGSSLGDVDLERANQSIKRSLTEGPDGPVLSPTKTRQTKCVALVAATAAALASFKSDPAPEAVASDRIVFSSEAPFTPWLPNRVTKVFIRCRRAVGLDGCRLHDQRHFMATDMLRNGEPIALVSTRLAHAKMSTTLDAYGHVIAGGDRDAAEALAGRLGTLVPARASIDPQLGPARARSVHPRR